MTTAVATMSDEQRYELVRATVLALENESARLMLEHYGLPVDAAAVHHLVYGRMLYTSLRLREHTT